jgi:putative phosphoribosyl transferase
MTWAADDVKVELEGGVHLEGHFTLPQGARGVVLFAHGSGSSRHSPRNAMVARALQNRGLGTLLLDLLTAEEEARERESRHLRFDIALLSARLAGAVKWLVRAPDAGAPRVGLFGASTGAAAALACAARLPSEVGAVVSRGGRPDLAGALLPRVQAPTLLIVGGEDEGVLELNQEALGQLRVADKRLTVVPGAGHLFEEPGALAQVAELAGSWFVEHLGRADWQGALPSEPPDLTR